MEPARYDLLLPTLAGSGASGSSGTDRTAFGRPAGWCRFLPAVELARDAGVLVRELGYTLGRAGRHRHGLRTTRMSNRWQCVRRVTCRPEMKRLVLDGRLCDRRSGYRSSGSLPAAERNLSCPGRDGRSARVELDAEERELLGTRWSAASSFTPISTDAGAVEPPGRRYSRGPQSRAPHRGRPWKAAAYSASARDSPGLAVRAPDRPAIRYRPGLRR